MPIDFSWIFVKDIKIHQLQPENSEIHIWVITNEIELDIKIETYGIDLKLILKYKCLNFKLSFLNSVINISYKSSMLDYIQKKNPKKRSNMLDNWSRYLVNTDT